MSEGGEPVVCDECDREFGSESARATHHAWKHTDNNPNSLENTNPEDLGLSPIGTRKSDG